MRSRASGILLALALAGAIAALLWRQRSPDAVTAPPAAGPDADSSVDVGVAEPALDAATVAAPASPLPIASAFCRFPGDSPDQQLVDILDSYVIDGAMQITRAASRLPADADPIVKDFVQQFPVSGRDAQHLAPLRAARGRRVGDVDVLVRGLVWLAWRQLHQVPPDGAASLSLAEEAVAIDGKDPVAHAARAAALEALGRRAEARDAIRRAFQLDPVSTMLARSLAKRLAHTKDISEALAALRVHLANADGNPSQAAAAARMEALLQVEEQIERGYSRRERAGVTLLWPEALLRAPDAAAHLDAVVDALDAAARLTRTRRRDELTVVIYPGREEIMAVTCIAGWATGVYDGTLRLALDPKEGRVRAEEIRHEASHAQLAVAVRGAPLWFEEGLADYLGRSGQLTRAAQARLRMLVDNRTWIPFGSLAGSLQSFDRADAGLAYSQSDAMVQLMISEGGEEAISRAVEHLERKGDPAKLIEVGIGRTGIHEADLLRFLQRILPPQPTR